MGQSWPGFCGPSYRAQSSIASPEECINWYPARIESPGAPPRTVLYPTPGLATFASAPEVGGRGIFSQADRCFAVIGPTLYEVLADGSTTSRGTVATDRYPAMLTTNGDGGGQLLIISGNTGYSYNLTTNVLTSEVSNVTMGGMIDGYGVALDIATSTLKVSDLLDFTTWDGTQTAQRSSASDPWRSMLVRPGQIWLFGERTSEVWYNNGNSPFPFAVVPGLLIPFGVAASFSPAIVGSSILWLTRNDDGQGQVVEAQGYSPSRVSTDPVEYALSQYTQIDDAVAWAYQEGGHNFYCLNFPSAGVTWVYDQTTGQWHKRGTWDSTTATYGVWGPQYHTFVYGKHLVLHSENGSIYRMASDLSTDADGNGLRRLRIPPALERDRKRVFLDSLELVLEPGLGLVSGQGSDPSVMLRLSRDGGKTWGNQRTRSAGVLGQYSTRTRWLRCGSGRRLVPEVVCSDPIPWRLLDLTFSAREAAA